MSGKQKRALNRALFCFFFFSEINLKPKQQQAFFAQCVPCVPEQKFIEIFARLGAVTQLQILQG